MPSEGMFNLFVHSMQVSCQYMNYPEDPLWRIVLVSNALNHFLNKSDGDLYLLIPLY